MTNYADSQLEAIYYHHMENKGEDEAEVACAYEKLYRKLEEFPWKKQNDVQCAVNELCAIIGRISFLDGLRSGANLVLKLTK